MSNPWNFQSLAMEVCAESGENPWELMPDPERDGHAVERWVLVARTIERHLATHRALQRAGMLP